MTNRVDKVIDTAIALVSPKRAFRRQHFRRLKEDDDYREACFMAMRWRGYGKRDDVSTAFDESLSERAYKSAGHSKNHTPWEHASYRSADAEILGDLYTMRNRSRAANRDDALTSGIRKALVRGVVGRGLRPQPDTGDERKNDALSRVWDRRKDKLSQGDGDMAHGLVQQMRYGKGIEDGGIFLRGAVAAAGEPVFIENIEADRCRTPYDAQPEDPEGRIVYGVEKDGIGRVVAYWFLKKHPGDTILWETKLGSKATPFVSTFSKHFFDRVPREGVYHHRSSVTRPGQTHGVPYLHAVMQDLRDLDLLVLAMLKKTQLAACLAVFLKSDVETESLLQLTAEDYGYQLTQKVEPGMIFRLYPGEEAQFLNPAEGASEFDKIIWLLARRVGSAVQLSPQLILRAWEGLSYSTARTVKNDDSATFALERDAYSHQLTWEYQLVMEDELLHGCPDLLEVGVTFEDLQETKVFWIGDEEDYVDPQVEAEATTTMLENGTTSKQIENRKLGRDWKRVLRDQLVYEKTEKEMREELDLPSVNEVSIAAGDADPPEDPGQVVTKAMRAMSESRERTLEVALKALERKQPPQVHLHERKQPAPQVHLHERQQLPPQISVNPIIKVDPTIEVHPTVEATLTMPEREFKFERKNGDIVGGVAKDKE